MKALESEKDQSILSRIKRLETEVKYLSKMNNLYYKSFRGYVDIVAGRRSEEEVFKDMQSVNEPSKEDK